jgi:hypothetical protein
MQLPSAAFPDVLAPEAMNFTTGESVYLRNFGPLLSYCQIARNLVSCGVGATRASFFNLEKVSSPGVRLPIDFESDLLYLKSGSRYCM